MSKYGRRAQAGGASVRGRFPPPTPYTVWRVGPTSLGPKKISWVHRTCAPGRETAQGACAQRRSCRASTEGSAFPLGNPRPDFQHSEQYPSPYPDTLTRGPLLPPCPGAPHLSSSSVGWGDSLSGLSGSFHIFCPGHSPATQTSLQQPHPN